MRAKRWAVALISTALVASACGGEGAADDDFQARLAELNAASAAVASEAEAEIEVVEAVVDGTTPALENQTTAGQTVGIPAASRLSEDLLLAATMTLLPEDLSREYPLASLRPSGTAIVDDVSVAHVGTNDVWAELTRASRLTGYRTELDVAGAGIVRTEVHLMKDDAAADEWLAHWVDFRMNPEPTPLGFSTTEVAGLPGDGSLYRWVESSDFLLPRVWRETAFASGAVVAIVTVDQAAPEGTTSAVDEELDGDTLWFAKRLAERVYQTSSGSLDLRDPEPAGYHSVADISDRYTVHVEVAFGEGDASVQTWRLRATRFGDDYQCQLIVDDGATEQLRTDVRVAHSTGYFYDASASNFAQTTVAQVAPLLGDCRLGSAAVVGYSFDDRMLLDSRPAVAPSGPVTRYSTNEHGTFAAATGLEMPDGVELVSYSEDLHPDGWLTRVTERWSMPGDFAEALFAGYVATAPVVEVAYDYRVVAVDDDVVAPDGPITLGAAVELSVGQTITEVAEDEAEDGGGAEEDAETPAEGG